MASIQKRLIERKCDNCANDDPEAVSCKRDTLSRANGLGAIKNRLNEIFKELINIRKNILFNRYFSQAEYSETEIAGEKFYKKFYPLTDEQKRLIIGFDVPYHLKRFDRDLSGFEKRLNNIKSAINLHKEK